MPEPFTARAWATPLAQERHPTLVPDTVEKQSADHVSRAASAPSHRTTQDTSSDSVTLAKVCCPVAPTIEGVSDRLLLIVNLGAPAFATCRIDEHHLEHRAAYGNITLIPPGSEWKGTMDRPTSAAFIAVPQQRLAVASALMERPLGTLRPRLDARSQPVLELVGEMTATLSQTTGNSDDQDTADTLVACLLDEFGSDECRPAARLLGPDALRRLNVLIASRLDGPIPVDLIADVAGQNRWQFPRLFRRTVGISPHQYVLRLRLRRARELIRRGCGLAEAALATGFSDQSHLTTCMRRIHGVTPARLRVRRRPQPGTAAEAAAKLSS